MEDPRSSSNHQHLYGKDVGVGLQCSLSVIAWDLRSGPLDESTIKETAVSYTHLTLPTICSV
eukprot:1908725-Prymnesium_polylepis.1